MAIALKALGLGRKRPKTFCIGFNKTGTSSLHEVFIAAGMTSFHSDKWPYASYIDLGRPFFDRAECYCDGEKSDFVRLQRWFPDALFVLNTRDERKWLVSRIKHVMRYNEIPSKSEIMRRNDYGMMAKEFYFNPDSAIAKWIIERRIYEDQARTFFADQPGFIELDVTAEKKWVERLNEHLASAGLPTAPADRSYHANKRDHSELADQAALDEYVAMMDRQLERFSQQQV
ncbi:MAG: hypothetical protein KDE25_04000 [Novosphingobium sp.]|nr:hypothetical protein [Novosphingobium sp.]